MKRAGAPTPIGPVTILYLGKVFLGRWRRGVVRHHRSHRVIRANVERSDEGITWIRGHHAPNSAAMIALRAAYALQNPKSSPSYADGTSLDDLEKLYGPL